MYWIRWRTPWMWVTYLSTIMMDFFDFCKNSSRFTEISLSWKIIRLKVILTASTNGHWIMFDNYQVTAKFEWDFYLEWLIMRISFFHWYIYWLAQIYFICVLCSIQLCFDWCIKISIIWMNEKKWMLLYFKFCTNHIAFFNILIFLCVWSLSSHKLKYQWPPNMLGILRFNSAAIADIYQCHLLP